MQFEGKTAVVTGAASGIGQATAEAFAAAGGAVVLGDINTENGEKVAAAIRDSGGTADFVELDVTDANSIAAFRDKAIGLRGQVDILANVAGWGKTEAFVKNTPEFWTKVVNLNLMGPIFMARAFVEPMMERNYGKVVTVASDAGRVGSLGESVYAGAKGGAIAFTKSLAREMARFKVNANCVCPGPTDTPLMALVDQKYHEAFIRATPLRRLGKASEVADAVLFFASDRASFVTGQVISVSGGLTMAG